MPWGLWAWILTSSLLGWGWRAHAYGIKRKVASCELLMSPLGSKQSRWFHFACHFVAGCVGGRCGRRDKFKFHYNVCLVVWWFNFYWHDFLATRSPVQSLDSARLSFLFHYTSPTREREKKNYEFCTCSMRGRRLEVKPQNFYKCDSRSHSRINLLKKCVAFLRLVYASSSYNLSEWCLLCALHESINSPKQEILFAFTTSRLTYKMFMTFREIVFDLLSQITCERKASCAHFTREKVLCVIRLSHSPMWQGKARQHFTGFNLHKFDI